MFVHPDPYKNLLTSVEILTVVTTQPQKRRNVNTDQTETLTRRILNAARSSGPPDEWRRVLTRHDHNHATQTINQCIELYGDTLTIRRYLDHYATNDPNRYWQPPPELEPPVSLDDALTIIGPELEPIRQLLARTGKGTRP